MNLPIKKLPDETRKSCNKFNKYVRGPDYQCLGWTAFQRSGNWYCKLINCI